MPKPIIIVYYPIKGAAFYDYERLVVKLQEQLNDYHVIGLPKSSGEVELQVKSAEYVSEYDILEAKEIITNEVKRYFDKQNLN
jgi:hypothetical protein